MFYSVPVTRTVKKCSVDIPPVFKEVFDRGNRYTIFYGGRGGGKSHATARILLQEAMDNKLKILCARATQVSIAESVHALLRDIIFAARLPFTVTHNKIRYTNGSEFIFKGLEGASNIKGLKSLEGADICWVEEAQFITRETFDVLVPTIRKANSRFICTLNPRVEDDPFYELAVSGRADVSALKVTYEDNEFLSEEARNEAEFMKEADHKLWSHIYGGELVPDDHCIFAGVQVYDTDIMPVDMFAMIDPAFGGGDTTAIAFGMVTADDILWVTPFAFHSDWQTAVSYVVYLLSKCSNVWYEGKLNEMINHHLATLGIPSDYIVTTQNKQVKIAQSYSYFMVDKVRYLTYSGSDINLQEANVIAMRQAKEWHKKTKQHDDAPDCVAMLIEKARR